MSQGPTPILLVGGPGDGKRGTWTGGREIVYTELPPLPEVIDFEAPLTVPVASFRQTLYTMRNIHTTEGGRSSRVAYAAPANWTDGMALRHLFGAFPS